MDDPSSSGQVTGPPTLDGAAPGLPPLPSPLGRKVLAFEMVVLLEYWLAPLFLGLTNYAGAWSELGAVLFAVFATTVTIFVVRPLIPRVRQALRTVRARVTFHATWITAFVVGLYVTNFFQFVSGPTSGPVLFGEMTVYSPFGAWPTLPIYVPALQLWATLNLEGPTLLFLLSILSAASILLGSMSRPRACPLPRPERSRSWRGRIASAGILAPLGLITGCPGCAPLYFALLSTIAPGAVLGGAASIPLVPWIGFAGVLYLFGFWLAIRLIHRATSPDSTPVPATVPG